MLMTSSMVLPLWTTEAYPTEAARMSTLSATPRFSALRRAFDGTKEDGGAGFERRRRVKRAFAQAPLVLKKPRKLTKFLAVIKIGYAQKYNIHALSLWRFGTVVSSCSKRRVSPVREPRSEDRSPSF